ncbi:hypothetical protein ANCCEY_06177 [Ancylostoma ceylanicum]|uniref:Uncharacterized protein n=1 Tax=Ancylostoma ceylanicum TaxID=53326 RepID=A0A0D6M4A9_9BILA|nr:hypothetical protein ANCCEY_06177 [Ancylostoma ceylanicum]
MVWCKCHRKFPGNQQLAVGCMVRRPTGANPEMIQNVADNVVNILGRELNSSFELCMNLTIHYLTKTFGLRILKTIATCKKSREQPNNAFNITGIVLAAQEEAHTQKETKTGDKVNLPTNDLTMMHEAIPFLPVPVALLCLFLNVVIPGTGTIRHHLPVVNLLVGVSQFFTITFLFVGWFWSIAWGGLLIIHSNSIQVVNLLVGVSQFFTITFLFVGWFWSIAWGGLLIIHSMQYREALQQRRQEAVATAAIEALTKDSILHRRDVKTLVKTHKQQAKDKKTAAS